MYCPFCGSEISDDSTFCPMCGQSINSPDVNVRKEEKESKKATGTMHWVLVLITVVLLLVTMIGIGTALYLHFRDSSEKISQEIKKDDLKKEVKKEKAEEETKDEEDLKEDVLQEEDESSDLEDEFWIDEDTKADYSENLDPDLYESYDSKITDFKFYYPVDLYNEVSVDEDPDLVSYGENCQTITFEGSDGSQLIFSLTSRTDALSIENMTENVYNIESKGLVEPEKIVKSSEGDHGKAILTGWDSSAHNSAIYDMTKIEAGYVLQMKVIFPDYTSEKDRLEKAYVTECLYRMCGFSDSSQQVRSWDEFMEENQMKRAFPVMAVLFCCMIFCMTGCGSSEKSDSGAKEEKTVKKQEQQNEKEEEKESEKEPEILQFVDVYGQQYSVEINQNIAKKQYNDTLFIHDGDRLTQADEKYTSRLGIDVSYHQGEIDWKKVKAAGYDFAFIRIGYRGYAEAGTVNADIRFDEYIQQAQNAGLDVGVYFFSQAVNEEEAREEAKFVLDHLSGYNLQLPVVFDPESILDDDARTDHVSGEQFTKNTEAFCSAIEAAGYDAMIYSNMLWEAYELDLEKLSAYPVWYADYELKPQTPYHFEVWQYTNQGSVDGINGRTDINIQLIEKPSKQD